MNSNSSPKYDYKLVFLAFRFSRLPTPKLLQTPPQIGPGFLANLLVCSRLTARELRRLQEHRELKNIRNVS